MNIKYQMLDDGWEKHISMQRKQIKSGESTYWMSYATVENTDHTLVKELDSVGKSPIHLKVKDQTSQ